MYLVIFLSFLKIAIIDNSPIYSPQNSTPSQSGPPVSSQQNSTLNDTQITNPNNSQQQDLVSNVHPISNNNNFDHCDHLKYQNLILIISLVVIVILLILMITIHLYVTKKEEIQRFRQSFRRRPCKSPNITHEITHKLNKISYQLPLLGVLVWFHAIKQNEESNLKINTLIHWTSQSTLKFTKSQRKTHELIPLSQQLFQQMKLIPMQWNLRIIFLKQIMSI
jgi:hypothetical protein